MARLLIYDEYSNRIYTYPKINENDPMPYSTESTLKVREFRGESGSPTLWTTTAAMEAWNLTRRRYGKGIYVGYAFRRIWEGGHGTRSQHYAGVAFDVGQNTTSANRAEIHNAALRTGAWGYVEPLSQTPTWVHFDRRYGLPACTSSGCPVHPGLLHRRPDRRYFRHHDRKRPAGLSAPQLADGGRRLRLQHLDQDHHRRPGGGPHRLHHRLRRLHWMAKRAKMVKT